MTKLEKELSMIFLAYQFSYLHIKQVVDDKGQDAFEKLKKPTIFMMSLNNFAKLYVKKSSSILEKATKIYEDIEKKARKIIPDKKFNKKVRFNEDNEIYVNGLLFAVSLILEHRNFKNRILRPDYKMANEIMEVYESAELNKAQMNARLLAQKYFDELEKI